MTLREYLNTRKKLYIATVWILLPLLFVILAMLEGNDLVKLVGIVGFATISLIFVYLWQTLKCPICKGSFYTLVMNDPWSLDVSNKIICCPYCGVEFDNEI